MKTTLLGITFLVLSASAGIALPAQVVPFAKLPFAEVQTATLPESLRETLLTEQYFGQDTNSLPDTLDVCRVDLNNDSAPEFIVTSRQSASAGAVHFVFARRGQHYKRIASFQAGFYLGPRVNGYYQICADPLGQRSGYALWVLRYARGKYREIHSWD